MNVQQEREFDDKIVSYVGTKLMKIGNFMVSISKVGSYITAIISVINYGFTRKLLKFDVWKTKIRANYFNDDLIDLSYYNINHVSKRVKNVLELDFTSAVIGGASFLCGTIGAATIALGDHLRCSACDTQYLIERNKK